MSSARAYPLLLFALCALFLTVKSHTTACNHGNDTTCLHGNDTYEGVKPLMQNCDYFWFGREKYNASCPENHTLTVACANPAPSFCSIITRMRMSGDDDTSGIEQVLHVHYHGPEASYRGCGNHISVPATDKMIDPVHTIYNDDWSLNQRPHVTWQAEAGKTYALAFWDAGWFQLKGLWVNIVGRRLEEGKEVIAYAGPLNPMTRKNPVVFLLFHQAAPLDVGEVLSKVDALREWNGVVNMVMMNKVMEQLNLTGPVGVSSVRTSVTWFSADYGLKAGIINNCPYLRTKAMMAQIEDTALVGIPGKELTVSVHVTYESPEVNLDVCCHPMKVTKRMVNVESVTADPIEPVYTRVKPKVTLMQTHIRDDPYFFDHPDRRFTLLFMDVTDAIANVTDKVTLHWQVINIRDPMLKTGETTLEYMGVHVPVASPERKFAFALLEQSGALTTQRLEGFHGADCQPAKRCEFDMRRFVKDLNLQLVGVTGFRAGVDPYSRHWMYAEDGRSKSAACVGVDGFSDPCPGKPSDDTCAGVTSLPSLLAVGWAAVVSLGLRFY